MKKKTRKIRESDLIESIEELSPSTIEWLQTARNLVKYANASGSYKELAKYLKQNKLY